MRGERSAYRVLVRQLEGKRPFGRLRRKWEDNIKIYPSGWVDLAEDRDGWWAFVIAVMTRILP